MKGFILPLTNRDGLTKELEKRAGKKTCTKCGKSKPLDEFHKHVGTIDGLQYACKSCIKAYQHKYYLRTTRLVRKIKRNLAASAGAKPKRKYVRKAKPSLVARIARFLGL